MTVSHITERATDGLAIASVATLATEPSWLEVLQRYSEIAGLLMPILGAVWLAVQIYARVFRNK